MLTEVTYSKIRQARSSHTRWVRRAKHLIEGLPVSEDMIPIDSTSCDFGMWFYEEGIKFKSVPALSSYIDAIEKKHNKIHDDYLKIYKIFFVNTHSSWIRSFLTKKFREVSSRERELALIYFRTLEKSSAELIGILENFENTLRKITLNDIYYG